MIVALEPIIRRGGDGIHASPRLDGLHEARAGYLILVTYFEVRTAFAIPVRVDGDSPSFNGLSAPDRIRDHIESQDPQAVRWGTGDWPYRFADNRCWRRSGLRRAWGNHTSKECAYQRYNCTLYHPLHTPSPFSVCDHRLGPLSEETTTVTHQEISSRGIL